MLNVYIVMSKNISDAIIHNDLNVTKQPLIKSMRTVKKEILKLISLWVSRSTYPKEVNYHVLKLIVLKISYLLFI